MLKPRLEAKKNGDNVMNTGFKLSLNSVYGKSNSEYSWLYDPLYTLKTTLAGQLSLVMLSEMLISNIPDLTMLQINTDGLTAKIPITEKRNFYNQCVEWESKTGLTLEYQTYKTLILRDVNNYIAQSPNGKVKYKGAFKTYSEAIKDEEYHKSLSQTIVPESISKYFLENIPVEETIMKCNDIYEFCKTFNATHGWTCETLNEQTNYGEIRQKTNRYYISTNGERFYKRKDDRVIDIEAGGTLVTIFNKFEHKDNFSDYNIDYDYYINECYKIIHKIDGTEKKLLQQKKEESELLKRQSQEEKFLKYCVNKVPTVRQLELYGKDWLIEKYGQIKTK